ncbi:hypothetical protein AALB_0075 [Agarivorans albus MKT 106]|uniref:Uncharacterized protein n=1 Tax=Agarivorans albus MKT 106 TaxID=1331007 RepID=R9PF36_AGAAL|nr:hypothetical protein AALB_0075 [Agarivorans albus MKT 106]
MLSLIFAADLFCPLALPFRFTLNLQQLLTIKPSHIANRQLH